MTRSEFANVFKEYLTRMEATMLAKNADYSGQGDDPFANFTAVERLGICAAETGFMTRMADKYCRIVTFVKKGVLQVKGETIEDTLLDLATYALLLAAFIKSRRDREAP